MKHGIITLLLVIMAQTMFAQCHNCDILEMLDEYPVYNDTISFTEHVKTYYHYPGEYHGLDFNILVEFEIDTTGMIRNLTFPQYRKSIDHCYQNVRDIFNASSTFIPGKKNGKKVCTLVRMFIPYSDPSGSIKERQIENWISVFEQTE